MLRPDGLILSSGGHVLKISPEGGERLYFFGWREPKVMVKLFGGIQQVFNNKSACPLFIINSTPLGYALIVNCRSLVNKLWSAA